MVKSGKLEKGTIWPGLLG